VRVAHCLWRSSEAEPQTRSYLPLGEVGERSEPGGVNRSNGAHVEGTPTRPPVASLPAVDLPLGEVFRSLRPESREKPDTKHASDAGIRSR
jgi:hypothetical protein